MATRKKLDQTIERGHGATYDTANFTVYEHSIYARGSVLAGQPRRVWRDDFPTLKAAQAAYPDAIAIDGTTFAEPSLNHLSDEGDL